jgi:hypothetical protein
MTDEEGTIGGVSDEAIEILQYARLVTGKKPAHLVSEAVLAWARNRDEAGLVDGVNVDIDWEKLIAGLQEHIDQRQRAMRELRAQLGMRD